MKRTTQKLALIAILALANSSLASDPAAPAVSPDEALSRLKAGNDRFVTSKESSGKPVAARRAETAQTQHPFATIIGCADSRTAPEIVFDQSIGDLFVIRTAGNLVDDYALGSIEYAVEHLGVQLIVVLGHERCGAVTAALASSSAPGHVNALVRDIQPAVVAAKGKEGDALANAIHENDAAVAAKIRKEAQFAISRPKFASWKATTTSTPARWNGRQSKAEWAARSLVRPRSNRPVNAQMKV